MADYKKTPNKRNRQNPALPQIDSPADGLSDDFDSLKSDQKQLPDEVMLDAAVKDLMALVEELPQMPKIEPPSTTENTAFQQSGSPDSSTTLDSRRIEQAVHPVAQPAASSPAATRQIKFPTLGETPIQPLETSALPIKLQIDSLTNSDKGLQIIGALHDPDHQVAQLGLLINPISKDYIPFDTSFPGVKLEITDRSDLAESFGLPEGAKPRGFVARLPCKVEGKVELVLVLTEGGALMCTVTPSPAITAPSSTIPKHKSLPDFGDTQPELKVPKASFNQPVQPLLWADAKNKLTRDPDFRFNIEQIFPVDTSLLIIRGWLHYENPKVRGQFKLHINGYNRAINPVKVIYYSRPDVKASMDTLGIKVHEDEAKRLGFYLCIALPKELADELLDVKLVLLVEGSKNHDLFKWNLARQVSSLSQLESLWNSSEREPLARAFGAVERLPKYLVQDHIEPFDPTSHGFDLALDWAFPADKCGILYLGWIVDAKKSVIGIFADNLDSGTGVLSKLLTHHFPRADLETLCSKVGISCLSAGLVFFNSADEEQLFPSNSNIIALLDTGQAVKLPVPINWISVGNPIDRIRKILDSFYYNPVDARKIFENYLGPTIQGIYRDEFLSTERQNLSVLVERFGKQLTSPEISIIVPLYGRYDFVMYQLAQFANDPEFISGNLELIYVCDDPRMEKALVASAAEWFPIYQVPFQIASYSQNLGYAGANNVGVSIAAGNNLILLNSDVLPREPEWASRMVQALTILPSTAIVGATLLFHDDTIQHAGIEYLRNEAIWGGVWQCHHPRKGMPFRDNGSVAPQAVAAVTGACLAVSRQTYQELGGLSEDYIIGDFEDSDFCLKARKAGGEIYLLPDVVLYHVERQSQSLVAAGHWKEKITIYNAWLHNQRWNTSIEALSGLGEISQ